MLRRAGAALLLLVLTGCQVRTDVVLHAAADGTGRVEVAVTLDKAAAARAAGTDVRTADLTGAGWEVQAPQRLAGGGVVHRAEKRFRSPEEAEQVLREVSGSALRGISLTRQRSFLRTRTSLEGTLDLRAGAAAFSDPALTEILGGQPVGLEPDRVASLDQALRLQVVAELPGRTGRWSVKAGEQALIAVSAEQWNAASIGFAVVALVALTAFVVSTRRAFRDRGR